MDFLGKQGFVWWKGVVEDRKDPLKLGRYKIRIIGWHSQDKQECPTEALPWAYPSLPIETSKQVVGLKEGDWCWGFFWDDMRGQEPCVVGQYSGIPEQAANPELGFFDPTPEPELTPDKQPRPPEYTPIPEAASAEGGSGSFSDPNVLPGDNVAFGDLQKNYNPQNYKWDVTKDGQYNAEDAAKIIKQSEADSKFAFGDVQEEASPFNQQIYPMSRYPLKEQLNEPTSSRLARNEEIDQTIVAKKKANLVNAGSASHAAMGVGSDEAHEAEPFSEPATPYAAIYPFNIVKEYESGHITEIDNTPQKERVQIFHRAGTFAEVHPDGTLVLKGQSKGYHIFIADFYFNTGKTANYSAAEDFLIQAGKVMNLQAGEDLNADSGKNHNLHVGHDYNTLVGHNVYTVIEGDVRILVKGNYNLAVEGDIKMKAKGDVLIDGANIRTTAKAENVVKAGAAVITEGPITFFQSPVTDGINIHATFADAATVATPGSVSSQPHITVEDTITKENDADNKQDLITSSSPKEGFVLVGPVGDLWKPKSDSDGKAVTLSYSASPHELYEALPTGELQDVELQYQHVDFSRTTWELVRPVHTQGRLIDRGLLKGAFGDGRAIYRWGKAGADYPKQMFLVIGEVKYLILDGAIRHEAFGGANRGF